VSLTNPTPPRPGLTLGSPATPEPGLQRAGDVLAEALANLPLSGRMGILAGALQDIAADMPGVRAVHKCAAMRERAVEALEQLNHAIANGDAE
jgi:hypothetical protein